MTTSRKSWMKASGTSRNSRVERGHLDSAPSPLLSRRLPAITAARCTHSPDPPDRGITQGQEFARRLAVTWAGGSDRTSPEELDAAIIFAPVGSLVPADLWAAAKGGTVVCGGIHTSDIPFFPYEILWGECTVRSVANLTR